MKIITTKTIVSKQSVEIIDSRPLRDDEDFYTFHSSNMANPIINDGITNKSVDIEGVKFNITIKKNC